jgi:hypothetical protein
MTRLFAFACGCGVLLGLHALWILVLIDAPGAAFVRQAIIAAPVMAALVTAWLAPDRRLVLGTLQGTCAALVAFASAAAFERLGYRHDSIGGPMATFAVMWFWSTALAMAGSVLVLLLRRMEKGKSQR